MDRTRARPWRRLRRAAGWLCVEAGRRGCGGHPRGTTACAPISDKTTAGNPDKCTKDQLGTLYPGVLTFGTDQPVYTRWYMGANPASREGFEATLYYDVAANTNDVRDVVRSVRVVFNAALAPRRTKFAAFFHDSSTTE